MQSQQSPPAPLQYDVAGVPYIRLPEPHSDIVWTGAHLENHAQSLKDYLSDPAVHTQLMNVPNPYAIEHAKSFLSKGRSVTAVCTPILKQPAPHRIVPSDIPLLPLNFLCSAASGAMLGSLTLKVCTSAHCEIGYWLAPSARGNGLMRASLQVAIEHARRDWDSLKLLTIVVRQGNEASRRVALGAGFKPVGDLREVQWPQSKGGGDAWLETLEFPLK